MRTRIAFSTVLFLAMIVFLGCEKSVLNSPTDSPGSDPGAISPLAKKPADKGGGKPAKHPPLAITYRDAAPTDKILSDGRGSYVDGECGVRANFTLNDVTVDPDNNRIRRKESESCGGTEPRFLRFFFDELVNGNFLTDEAGNEIKEVNVSAFMNAHEVELVTVADGPVFLITNFHTGFPCGTLRFNPDFGVDMVRVTRISEAPKDPDDVWEIEAVKPNGTPAVGACTGSVSEPSVKGTFKLPFKITVQRKAQI